RCASRRASRRFCSPSSRGAPCSRSRRTAFASSMNLLFSKRRESLVNLPWASARAFRDQVPGLPSLFWRMSAPVSALSDEALPVPVPEREGRLAAMAAENFHFIWRSLRRLGVPVPLVDDAAQQVFEVAARRLDEVELGRERAFLFKTAL